jgi:hypothetical protein
MFSISIYLSTELKNISQQKRERKRRDQNVSLSKCSLSLCCLTFACAFSGSNPMLGSRSGSCPFGAFLAPNANVRTRSPRLKVGSLILLKVVFALIDDDDDDDARPRGAPIIEDTGRGIIPDEEEDIARHAPNLTVC